MLALVLLSSAEIRTRGYVITTKLSISELYPQQTSSVNPTIGQYNGVDAGVTLKHSFLEHTNTPLL